MGQHRSRWYLASTIALALITSSGVVGVALGPLFARPVQFETSAGSVEAVAGGQVGQVERLTPVVLPPTKSVRPVPRPAAGRTLTPTPTPVIESPPSPENWGPWSGFTEPEPSETDVAPADPTPSPSGSPDQTGSTCDGGWSE
jgi:hypothetical protein